MTSYAQVYSDRLGESIAVSVLAESVHAQDLPVRKLSVISLALIRLKREIKS